MFSFFSGIKNLFNEKTGQSNETSGPSAKTQDETPTVENKKKKTAEGDMGSYDSVNMDPDVRVYQSTGYLAERLDSRATWETKRRWDHVTLDDVAREMDDLKNDKEVDDQIIDDIRNRLNEICKNTIITKTKAEMKDRPKLTPARISVIENRLRNDPTLQVADETIFKHVNARAASEVKTNMVKTYYKIKKTSFELEPTTMKKIEDRIETLKGKKRGHLE
mmetsp:Transcript_105784/g.166997  ORF Transcript_105784/g.166997 Transcript_105784/m.166997 type:complete len:220 (-) Transcript_105784:66-725(-)